jgi:hypothetical protein
LSPLRIAPYVASLPERLVRSAAALAGGLLHELSEVTLPAPFRRTKLYRTMVETTLRFVIERVGDVQGAFPNDGLLVENFVTRRTAGNGIELLGILAFRASPVWVLAALADLSGAGRQMIQEIAESMKQEGLLDPTGTFASMDQILDGLERSSSRLADTINTPPLDVPGLRQEWAALRDEFQKIPPRQRPGADQVSSSWRALQREAEAQGLSTFRLSSLLALSALRGVQRAGSRTGRRFMVTLLDHYSQTLAEIHRTGYLAYWMREFSPYLRAAAGHFSPRRGSLTQRLLRRRKQTPAPPPR